MISIYIVCKITNNLHNKRNLKRKGNRTADCNLWTQHGIESNNCAHNTESWNNILYVVPTENILYGCVIKRFV